jgi:hypothetical protein
MKKWLTFAWITRINERRANRARVRGSFVLDDLYPLCFVVEFASRGPSRSRGSGKVD